MSPHSLGSPPDPNSPHNPGVHCDSGSPPDPEIPQTPLAPHSLGSPQYPEPSRSLPPPTTLGSPPPPLWVLGVPVRALWVVAQQGKSPRCHAWPYELLWGSNAQLLELSPHRRGGDYVVPPGGVLRGLGGRAVLLSPIE